MIDYKSAGVNIDVGNAIVDRIKSKVKKTFTPEVLTDLGGFAGLYDLKDLLNKYDHPVLVQSIDGLGTKPTVARLANQYDKLGHDLLSATANDILVLGAKPLTLLDYVASETLDATIVETIVGSIADACCENNVSLIGGETAEMPGVYQKNEIDVAGIITGIVDKNKIINGSTIKPGDCIYGLSSNGLHTNGYSLARKLIFDVAKLSVSNTPDGFSQNIGDALLAPHINYGKLVHALLDNNVVIHGMAHITGGGLLENVPRVLPKNCSAKININAWPALPLFDLLKKLSGLPNNELYRTFNMGIGYVIVAPQDQAAQIESIAKQLPAYHLNMIGEIVEGKQEVLLTE